MPAIHAAETRGLHRVGAIARYVNEYTVVKAVNDLGRLSCTVDAHPDSPYGTVKHSGHVVATFTVRLPEGGAS